MLSYDDPADVSPARAAGFLTRGGQIKTPIEARPEVEPSAAGTIVLKPGDEVCSKCGSVIEGFGIAPYILVLGRMKRETDGTYCDRCHQPGATTTSQ